MITSYVKSSIRGNYAETRIELKDNYILVVLTMKRANKMLMTTASLCRLENGYIISYPFSDVHKTYAAFDGKATAPAIKSQHDSMLNTIKNDATWASYR